MNKKGKNCVLLPAAGRRTQLFLLTFTEPEARSLAKPCREKVVRRPGGRSGKEEQEWNFSNLWVSSLGEWINARIFSHRKEFLTSWGSRTEGFLRFKDCLSNSLIHSPFKYKFVRDITSCKRNCLLFGVFDGISTWMGLFANVSYSVSKSSLK